MPVIWLWHPWRQLQGTRFVLGFKKKSLYVSNLIWYKMPPTLFQKLFNKRNAFSSPPPRCNKEDPVFRYLFILCVCLQLVCLALYVWTLTLLMSGGCRALFCLAWTRTVDSGAIYICTQLIIWIQCRKVQSDVGDVQWLLVGLANMLMLTSRR